MKKNVYLLLALTGLIVPYGTFFFLLSSGESIAYVFDFLFANAYTAFFTVDLVISVIVFWFFMINEAQKLNMENWWLYILASLIVGLSFALPLFLYFRGRHRENNK